MPPAAEVHGAIQNELGALLRNHLLATGSRCRVIGAPPSQAVMVPEPVLLSEILSPGNEPKTRSTIWTYTTIPSVREILAVRGTRMEVELLRRLDDGSWPAASRATTISAIC